MDLVDARYPLYVPNFIPHICTKSSFLDHYIDFIFLLFFLQFYLIMAKYETRKVKIFQ